MSPRRGTVAVVVASGLAAGCLGVALPVEAQDEIAARGNQAYQDGDYAAAIDAYEAVEAAGFQSAGLQYNLGNAYFKAGDLGRSILHWERAAALSPGDPDVLANLALARSLTVDAVEPIPTFWLFSVASWWVRLLPRNLLMSTVALSWLALTAGVVARILTRREGLERAARWTVSVGVLLLVLFGTTLFVRELGIGVPERAVILVEAVAVRSAPAEDDDLTLFEVHEGTRVRIDQRTGAWAEVVLDDGKVGWLPLAVMETI